MNAGLSLRRLTAAPAPKIVLLPLLLLLNAGLVWLAGAVDGLGAIVLVLGATAAESFLLLRVEAPAAQEAGEPRLASLFNRSRAVRQNSIRDEATGLFNRWYLDMRLEEEGARCRRYNLSMAVIVIRTGLVNLSEMSLDAWQVQSAEIAQKTLEVVREADLSACLAPFEFAVCLVHCDRAGAEAALQRLRAKLANFSCKSGIAVYPDDNCAPRALIELARVRVRSSA
jgi:GGDEF domain-containing protein